jgi:hypothetical protein
LSHSEGRQPLRRCGLRLNQGRARLLQCLVPLQECGLDHVDRSAPFTVWALWSRSASRTARSQYSSQPLSVLRASTKASRASYYPWYQLSSMLNWVRQSYLARA